MTKTLYFYVDPGLDIDRVISGFIPVLHKEHYSIYEQTRVHGSQSLYYMSDRLELTIYFTHSGRYRKYDENDGVANEILFISDIPKAVTFLARYIYKIEGLAPMENKSHMDSMRYHTEFGGKRVKDMTIKEALNSYYGLTGSFNFDEFPLAPHYKTYKIIPLSMQIEKVIYASPATIIIWKDGSKTVVKCQEDDEYSYAAGIMHAIIRKIYGDNNRQYSDILKWISTAEEYDKACEAAFREERDG